MSEEDIKKTIGLDDKENMSDTNWLNPVWPFLFLALAFGFAPIGNKETMKMPDCTQSYISYLNGKVDAYEKMFTEK